MQGDLDITEDLTIVGLGPLSTTIDARGIDRVLDIHQWTGAVVISGVTLLNGDVTGSGAGIHFDDYYGTLTLINTVVASNTASSCGGGIVNDSGNVTLIGTTVASNTAGSNGGVYL